MQVLDCPVGPRSVAQVGKQDLVPHLCWHLLAVPLTGANTRALSASPEGWWQPVWLFPWLKAECFLARVGTGSMGQQQPLPRQ